MNGLDHLEAELLVNFRVDGIATLKIARPVFRIALFMCKTVRARILRFIEKTNQTALLTCRVTDSIKIRA